MERAIQRLSYYMKFGGIKLPIMKVMDKLCGTHKTDEYIYNVSIKASPDKYAYLLSLIYGMKLGKKLNLENPQTFNEKIQWLKLYDTTELKTQLADKWRVREWVAQKIGVQYLIPLLGVWNSFDEIDLERLPNRFVLKTNHASGANVIVLDKQTHDWHSTKIKFEKWMEQNFAYLHGFELQYKDIKPKIIAEEYIETKAGNLYDYKRYCFNGVPKYIAIIGDRVLEKHTGQTAFYNTDWKLQSFDSGDYPRYKIQKKKPDKLEEMLFLAKKLSKGFSFVRVDLYELDNGEVKFGELTFTPGNGMFRWIPEKVDLMFGEKIILPKHISMPY